MTIDDDTLHDEDLVEVSDEPTEQDTRGSHPTWWHTSFAAAGGAITFGALSLTPSLLPRSGVVQGLVFGVGIAVGYGLGSFLAWLVRQFTPRTAPWCGTPRAWLALGIVSVFVTGFALWSGKRHQNDLHVLADL